MRVVSLLPAATEIVAALGARHLLVGVSHDCDYPPEIRHLPRVTRTTIDTTRASGAIDREVADARRAGIPPIQVDVDLVRRLAPAVVLGQSVCDVCAVGEGELARLAAGLDRTTRIVTLHAHDLNGVFTDIRRAGEALGLADEADEVVGGLRYRLRRLTARHRAARGARPRVLVLEWLDPPYVAGHWVPELVEAAGGTDVGGRAGEPSVARPWDELEALGPDVVVVACCGFDDSRARAELAGVVDVTARRLLAGRVAFLDGNAYTSRPGPRLVEGAEILARLISG